MSSVIGENCIVAAIYSERTAIALVIPYNWVGLRDMLYWDFVFHFITDKHFSHADSYSVVKID